MGVIDEASAARLRSTATGWLTTVRADGQPQSSYVWFHFDGSDIAMMSEPRAGKVRNLAGNPRVSFHLDGNPQTGGEVLTMDATAEVLGDGMPPERLAAYMEKYGEAIRRGPWGSPEAIMATFSVAILIVPTRLRAW